MKCVNCFMSYRESNSNKLFCCCGDFEIVDPKIEIDCPDFEDYEENVNEIRKENNDEITLH